MDYRAIIFCLNFFLIFQAIIKLKKTRWYILSLSYGLTILLHFFGSYVLLYRENWWIRYVSKENLIYSFILTQSFIFVLSIVIIFKKYKHNNKTIKIWDTQGIEHHFFIICIVMGILGIGLTFKKSVLYNFIVNPEIDKLILANYRNLLTFSGNKAFLYFKNIYLEYLSVLIFSYYSIRRFTARSKTNEFLFFSSIFVVVFGALLTLSKAPILKVILLYSFLKFVYGKNYSKNYSVTTFFSKHKQSFVAAILLLVVMFGVTKGFDRYLLFDGVVNRIFISQHVGLPNAFEFFPEHYDFLGLSFISPSVSRILGIEYNKFSRILMEAVNLRSVNEDTSGYLSTIFFAESYAIGGIFFVIFSTFVVLFLLIRIDNLYFFSNYPLWHAFYALLFIKIPFLINDSLKGLFFNVPLIFCIMVVFCFHLFNNKNKRYQIVYKNDLQ